MNKFLFPEWKKIQRHCGYIIKKPSWTYTCANIGVTSVTEEFSYWLEINYKKRSDWEEYPSLRIFIEPMEADVDIVSYSPVLLSYQDFTKWLDHYEIIIIPDAKKPTFTIGDIGMAQILMENS